jgi:hypothetical protein
VSHEREKHRFAREFAELSSINPCLLPPVFINGDMQLWGKPDHRVSLENLSRFPDRFSETAAGGEHDSPDHHWEDSRALAILETMTDSIMSSRQMCHLFVATTGSGRLLTGLASLDLHGAELG